MEQKATSRGVSEMEVPTLDLNHWRSPSISEISAIGVLQTYEASSVRSSNACSGSVSRMAYSSSAATRARPGVCTSLGAGIVVLRYILGRPNAGDSHGIIL